MPRRPGILGGGMLSPLTHMGIGLLSQGYSRVPQSPLQGLGAGLLSYQAAAEAARREELAQQRMDLAERQFKEEQEARAAEAQRAAEQGEAWKDYVYGLSPEITAGLGGAERIAALGAEQGMGIISPHLEPAGAEGLKVVMDPQTGQRTYVPASQAVGMRAPEPAAAATVNISQGAPYKPQTEAAKIAADIAYWQEQPESRIQRDTLQALRARQAKASAPTGEAATRAEKYAGALAAATEFVELSEQAPSESGPVAGRMTRLQAQTGFGAEPQESRLFQLENTARSQLGTALSGAAIPISEWPTYMAQIPTLTDPPEVQRAKLEQLRKTVEGLEARRKELLGQTVPSEPEPAPQEDVIQWDDLAPQENVIQWDDLAP